MVKGARTAADAKVGRIELLVFKLYKVSGQVIAGLNKDALLQMLSRQSIKEIVGLYQESLLQVQGNPVQATWNFFDRWKCSEINEALKAARERKGGNH